MARYIRDIFTLEYKWIEDDPPTRIPPRQVKDRTAFHVIRDIEPYQSAITGEVIGGRRQHREHLREHDCIEVGNEKPKPREPVRLPDARHDVKAAMDMVRGGHRPAPLETLKDWSR